MALGYKAVAGYTASTETLEGATVAIGATASATGNGSTALGYGAQTTGNDAVSVGSNSYATAKDSIALGSEAGAQGQASMALGADSWAAGESAVALGHQSYANGAQSLAFGFYSQTGLAIPVYNEDQTEITGYNYVGGKNSQAIGDNSRAYGNNSVAIGGAAIAGYYTYNRASQSYSSIDGGTAVGYGAQALADLSSAFGIGSKSLGAGTLAIGANSMAAASTIVGSSYKADYSTAMGYTAQTWAGYSTAIGYQAATKFQTDDLVTDTATNTKTATVSFGHQAGDYYAEAKTDSAGNVTYEIKAYGDNVLSRLTNVAYGSAKNEAAAWGQIAANYVEGTTNDIVINTANPSGEIKANDGTTLAKITVTGDGVIEKNNTGLISGGTAYDYLSPAANGSYIKTGGTDGYTTAENLTALDKAIGKVETKGNYISAQNGTTVNVAKNLQELDQALYEHSRIVRVSDDDKTQILVGNGTQYANVTTINVGNNGTTRKITGVTYGEATNDAAAYGQILAADQKIQLGMKDGNMTLKANDKTTLATFSITEANVLANDQGIVTGNVAYNELRKDVTGNYVDGDFNTGKNLSALDQAIGQTTQGKYISAQNGKTVNVAKNLTELDTALYDQSKLVRIGGDNNDKILIGRNKDGTEFDAIQTIDVSNGSNRTIMGVAAGTKTGEAATWEQLASNNNGTAYEMGTDGVITVKTNGNTDAFKLKISVSGIIDDGDTGLITGATAYDELRKNVNGEYIDAGNDTGTNLSNLDAEIVNLNKKISDGLYTGSDTITISDTNQISVTNMAMSTTGANLGATAGGAYSFAIGGGANASGAQSVALGYKAVASGTASEETLVGATVAIGATASATGNGSTALGYGASTKGNDAAALGSFAQADAKDSAAIGSNAHAYNTGAMAFGAESIAYGEGAAAFGYESKALGARSLAFGQNAKAGLYVDGQGYYGGGDDSIAIGGQSMAHGNYSVAIGYAAAAGGYDASAYVFYKGATAIGLGAGAFHEGATAIGDGSRALGEGSTAIGLNTYANAEFSTTHGFQAQALGKESMALGYQAVASQDLVTEDGNKVATVSFGHQSGDKYYTANTSGGYDENSYNDVVLSRLTNVADGKANTDAATYGQLVKNQEYVFNADGVATIETNSSTEENKKVAFTLKLENGKIADSDEGNGYVTGKKIYEELRPTDGKYVKKDNTTAANLNALDAQVKLNYDDITQLKDLSNITTAGEKVIRDLSKNAVKLEAGDNISIKDSEDADGNKTYVISADLENSAELAAKANLDASNIGSNLKGADGTSAATEAEKKANLDAWGNALGTGTVTGDSVQLITGKTLYNEVRPSSGTYISAGNTTGENLVNLDKQVLANTTAISNLSTRVDGIESNIDSKIDSKIDGKVDGITLENKVYTFSKDNAQQAITYKDGTSTAFTIKIDGLGEGGTGTTYKAGNGIAIDTSSETPTISVKVAGDDLAVSESGLAVKKDGKVESGNTGLVTGGTVYDALQTMDNQVAQLSNDINQVGAGAAALAALRPEAFDPDDKWSFAVGYGHYKNANASALGVFFKPNADTTISLGGTLGNGDSMMNAGLSFKIGKRGKGAGLYRSNVELVREVSSLREDSTALKENDRIQKQMLNAQGERIAALEAENARMRQQIEAILSKVELSDTVTRSAVR